MKPGVLIISHGSPDPVWIKLVDEATLNLKLPPGIPAEASFLEGAGGKDSGIESYSGKDGSKGNGVGSGEGSSKGEGSGEGSSESNGEGSSEGSSKGNGEGSIKSRDSGSGIRGSIGSGESNVIGSSESNVIGSSESNGEGSGKGNGVGSSETNGEGSGCSIGSGKSRDIQSGIDALEAAGVTDLVVIPLFVSSGSTHIDELAYAFGLKVEPELPASFARPGRLGRLRLSARVHFGQPVDDDPVIASMLWDKLAGLSQAPEREAVIVVGHGSGYEGFRQRWEAGISRLAERLKAISGAAAADYALLRPDNLRSKVSYWQELNYDVLVAPLFLSEGYFTKQVIPGRLKGFKYRYSGEALLPHPALGHWISEQIFTIMRSLTF